MKLPLQKADGTYTKWDITDLSAEGTLETPTLCYCVPKPAAVPLSGGEPPPSPPPAASPLPSPPPAPPPTTTEAPTTVATTTTEAGSGA